MINIHNKSRKTLPDTLNFLANGDHVAPADKENINLYKNNSKFQFDRLFKFKFIPVNIVYRALLMIKFKASDFDN